MFWWRIKIYKFRYILFWHDRFTSTPDSLSMSWNFAVFPADVTYALRVPRADIRDCHNLHSIAWTLRRSTVSCVILQKYCVVLYDISLVFIIPAYYFILFDEEYHLLAQRLTLNSELWAWKYCAICSQMS